MFLPVETFDAINLLETVVPNKKSKVFENLEKRVEADIRIAPVAAQMIWIEKDMKFFKGVSALNFFLLNIFYYHFCIATCGLILFYHNARMIYILVQKKQMLL